MCVSIIRLTESHYIVEDRIEDAQKYWRSRYFSPLEGATALLMLRLFAWDYYNYKLGQSETPIFRVYSSEPCRAYGGTLYI